MDTHHLLPSFTWDALTASWVPDLTLNRGAQTSTFGVKSSCILDSIPKEDLPTPSYLIGDTISFFCGDGIAFSSHTITRKGTIASIRLIGQRYVEEASEMSSKGQGHCASLWRQRCYSLDRIVYIVQNDDCTPWVDGYRILGQVQEQEKEEVIEEEEKTFSDWDNFETENQEYEEEVAFTF